MTLFAESAYCLEDEEGGGGGGGEAGGGRGGGGGIRREIGVNIVVSRKLVMNILASFLQYIFPYRCNIMLFPLNSR